VPTRSPFIHTARERAQFEVEGGQDQQQALQGEAPRLQFELGEPGLAGTTGLEGQLLLTQALLPPDAFEEHPELGRGADYLLACGHDLLGISINVD
jgi:hypothetical protein